MNSAGEQFTRKVSFKTLGCKLNQAETEALASGFSELGWFVTEYGDAADAIVLNTCTVTNTADRKSRAAVRQALRLTKGGLVVVSGCFVDAHKKTMETNERMLVVENRHKTRIPQLVDAYFRGEYTGGFEQEERNVFGYPLIKPFFRTRAMVKMQDGCDNHCTFCVIPSVRGRAASRSLEDVVNAVRSAVTSGYKEVVLTGVNMSRWQEGNKKFSHLVEACLNVKTSDFDFRLRLGSVEPEGIGTSLLSLMAHPRMAPHMHLCLQSGAPRVLLAMRRQYTVRDFEYAVDELRRNNEAFNITTDIIVGFPGETREDFEETLNVCRRLKFGHIHTFPYSPRRGTRADRMKDQIPEETKKKRAKEIRQISEELKQTYRMSLVGTVQTVLSEEVKTLQDESLSVSGLSGTYVPVRFPTKETLNLEETRNKFFSVLIRGIEEKRTDDSPDSALEGEVIS